jgi:simple sugar transport system permease protein
MRTLRAFLTDLLLFASSIAAAGLLLALGLAAARYPAWGVLREWAVGAAGTRGDLLVALKNACPLILTGLAAGVAFRSGVFNIGAEGQSILGAAAATAVATRLFPGMQNPALAMGLALLAGALGGAGWGAVAALLERYRGVPIVLSTILLNFIALQLLGLLLEGPLRTHSSEIVQSDILGTAYRLPILVAAGGGYLHAGFVVAVGIALACWLVQSRTTYGFEMLVTGLNPVAALHAGMPVAARQFGIMLWSGAFAGVAGAIQVMGIEGHSLSPTPVSYGYAGIAVALLGRLHPVGIIAAAIFFGLLDRGASGVELSAYALPHEVADIVKGLIVLVILAGTAAVARRRTMAREG